MNSKRDQRLTRNMARLGHGPAPIFSLFCIDIGQGSLKNKKKTKLKKCFFGSKIRDNFSFL